MENTSSSSSRVQCQQCRNNAQSYHAAGQHVILKPFLDCEVLGPQSTLLLDAGRTRTLVTPCTNTRMQRCQHSSRQPDDTMQSNRSITSLKSRHGMKILKGMTNYLVAGEQPGQFKQRTNTKLGKEAMHFLLEVAESMQTPDAGDARHTCGRPRLC